MSEVFFLEKKTDNYDVKKLLHRNQGTTIYDIHIILYGKFTLYPAPMQI